MLAVPNKKSKIGIRGVARMHLAVPNADVHKVNITGMTTDPSGVGPVGLDYHDNGDGTTTITGYRRNAFLNQGLEDVLDSAFAALAAQRITHIGLSGDSSVVSATTTTAGTPNSIKTISNVGRVNRTVSGDQTWTQADVAFPITKIFLASGNAPTAAVNIIGGVGGAAPYNEPFTIDLTNIATWTLTMGIDTTLTAS